MNSNSMLSWSVGEISVTTLAGNHNLLTQGFHQSKLTITLVSEPDAPEYGVIVFPNPFLESITVKSPDNQLIMMDIEVYTLNGMLLVRKRMVNHLKEISFLEFPSGVYILKLSNEKVRPQIFKVVKN